MIPRHEGGFEGSLGGFVSSRDLRKSSGLKPNGPIAPDGMAEMGLSAVPCRCRRLRTGLEGSAFANTLRGGAFESRLGHSQALFRMESIAR